MAESPIHEAKSNNFQCTALRQLTGEELRKERVMLLEAQRIAKIGCWEWDLVNKQLTWSDEIFRIFGLEPGQKEASVALFFKHMLSEDRRFIKKCVRGAIKGQPYAIEHRYVTADGTIGWIYDQGEAVLNEKGQPLRLFGVVQDITQRKFAEEALRESEERYRQLVDLSPAAIIIEQQGKIEVINNAATEMLGIVDSSGVIGKPVTDFLNIDYCWVFKQRVGQLLEKKTPFIREKLIRRDGKIIDVGMSAVAFNYHGKQSLRLTIWDMTYNRQREEEYIKATKLKSVSVLAAGIAHDFNNILTIILGYLSIARNRSQDNEEIYSKLIEAEKATHQAKGLTQQLLTFAAGGAPVKQTACIGELIKDTATFALHGSNIRCEFSFADNLLPAEVNQNQISQALNNLIINASQAMPGGGTVNISAENYTVAKADALPLQGGDHIKISVSDEGEGILPEIINSIFDPYFTTKPTGTGLGLTTCYSIIKRHDGYITVDSNPGAGTTFSIYLPVSLGKIAQSMLIDQKTHSGRGRILVMDDDEIIRRVTGEMLPLLGYQAELASNGYEAIEQYLRSAAQKEPFAAVILDLTVRGSMGGKETIQKLLEIDPQVCAIVSSGYSNDPVLANYESYGFKGMVAKPYQLEELGEVLLRVLSEQQ
ncbi:MAG: PAS domain S-box protein [Dethiobacter sp.]|jgi:PAS domain S-box-containing protein|nr:PAS domain S-box protein [Dethiobacter sp.]